MSLSTIISRGFGYVGNFIASRGFGVSGGSPYHPHVDAPPERLYKVVRYKRIEAIPAMDRDLVVVRYDRTYVIKRFSRTEIIK